MSSAAKRARRLQKGEHYAAGHQPVFQQVSENFKSKEIATLAVRRVVPSGGTEELQIEVTLRESYETGRAREMHCSFILNPTDADALGRACLELLAKPETADYGPVEGARAGVIEALGGAYASPCIEI